MRKLINKIVGLFHKNPKVISFVMSYKGKHMEGDFTRRRLTYRYVISPTEATGYFPEGYFDKHSVDLDRKELSKIKKQLQNCIRELPLERVWEFLFYVGESSDRAYLRCTDAKGNQYIYSTVKVLPESSSATRITVHEKYMDFYQFLLKRCDFPEYKPENWGVPVKKKKVNTMHSDETVWLCGKCGSSNLMQHKFCVICGETRGW